MTPPSSHLPVRHPSADSEEAAEEWEETPKKEEEEEEAQGGWCLFGDVQVITG